MARTPSSARRKRRQHALASPRPARAAHQDARPEESFCFTLSTKGPGVSGKIKMEWHGSSLSLTAKAVAMLILVTAACLAAIAITVACKLAAVTALAVFPAVLIAGMIVFFRLGTRQPGPGRHRHRRPQR
jgi:hypothetical protein